MSLTSHLKDPRSPVRAFLHDRFPNTREVIKDCRARLVGVETIRPPASAERYPNDLIGMAFDYRLRFYFAETALQALVAYDSMRDMAVGYRLCRLSAAEEVAMMKRGVSMHDLGDFNLETVPLVEVRAEEVLTEVPHLLRELKVVGRSMFYNKSLIDDLSANFDEACSVCGQVFLLGDATIARPNVDEFADRLRDALADLRPVGRRLPQSQEELLARYCIVLALYETIFRSGHASDELRLPPTDPPLLVATVDQLLAIPQPTWVNDLCNLSWAFHDDNPDLPKEKAVLNPTFDGSTDVGGADADIVIDDCLIEVKLTIDAGLKRVSDWLYQLIGYTLLDYSDEHGIRNVALFLPRQRTWLRWPLADLINKLSGANPPLLSGAGDEFRTTLGTLRAEFRRVVEPLNPLRRTGLHASSKRSKA